MRYASEKPASFTCPRCGFVSYNPHDIAHACCGRCHVFINDGVAPPDSPDDRKQVTWRSADEKPI
jgi:hypothetical protein